MSLASHLPAALSTKAALGMAAAAVVVGGGAAATASTGSANPVNWGQAVVQTVQMCRTTYGPNASPAPSAAPGTSTSPTTSPSPTPKNVGQCVSQFAKQKGEQQRAAHVPSPGDHPEGRPSDLPGPPSPHPDGPPTGVPFGPPSPHPRR